MGFTTAVELDAANAAYWLARHAELEGDIRSVGHRGLDIATNSAVTDRKRQLLARMLHDLPTGSNGNAAIDIGCGIGRYSAVFIDYGFDYEGIDISPIAIRQAERACPKGRFTVASLLEWLPSRAYDVVFISDVLCHCVSPRAWDAALSLIARCLAPAGTAIVFDKFGDERYEYRDYVLARTWDETLASFRRVGLTVRRSPLDDEAVVATRP